MPSLAPVCDPPPANPRADPFPDLNLIDRLLAEQGTLQTPVARFAREHELHTLPSRADTFRHLIPLDAPREGEQFAFQVELDKCTSCKSCVTACHSLNGLDDHESWRDVGILEGGDANPEWTQTITSACHHCADPGCLTGCPVAAYEKDATTGIVRHLDDQCIGCEYCILKCPYDVPKYSSRLGIVRKCDMCHQRLADGEAPACVQACPNEAIRIVTVDTGALTISARLGHDFLAGAPGPELTVPTTRYIGRDVPSTATPSGRGELIPEPAHRPLVAMLTLTQAGLGVFFAGLLAASNLSLLAGACIFMAGLAASIAHLGRPLGAWRFFLGLRTSWLSREILAFSLIPPLFALPFLPIDLAPKLLVFCVMAVSAIFTSIMVYHDTGRVTWRFPATAFRFMGTAIVVTLATLSATGTMTPWLAVVALLMKFAGEASSLRPISAGNWSPQQHSAHLQAGPLLGTLQCRFALGFLGIALLLIAPALALPVIILGELHERLLFFQSVWAPKMTRSISPVAAHAA